jgi:PBP1b-binding outer membrane lipoprotein LpoB
MMNTKKYRLFLFIPLLLILVGCSAIQVAAPNTSNAATTGTQAAPQGAPGGAPNMANQPIESKLALGTLKLEGSAQAVTADQAKALLPLWKAVKSLSASQTASADEVAALYTQIQESMSADQIAAIKALSMTQEDTQALMTQYGIQMPQGVRPGQSTTRTANQQSGTTGGPGAGGPPDGGGFPAGGPPDGGGFPGGGAPGANGPQTTPPAGQRRPAGGGMNALFVDPVITLLEKRANP